MYFKVKFLFDIMKSKKENILKNMGNQTFDGPHWIP